MPPAYDLDSIDYNIVRELASDARLSFAELGRRVGLSPSAVAERVHQLEPLIERLLPYGMPTTSMVLSTPVYRQQEAWLLKGHQFSKIPSRIEAKATPRAKR